MHLERAALQGLQISQCEQTGQLSHPQARVFARQQLALRRAVWVAQRNTHQKPVKLRLGQRISAQLLYRVLRGNHKKRLRQCPGLALDGHLFFFHGFEQRALSFGAGAVDFIGQQHLRKHRSGMENKGLFAALENRHAREVTGHQVGGELHP